MTIVDGRTRFGCSLEAFYQQHDIVQAAANMGILVPPVGKPDPSDPPALARVNPLMPLGAGVRWVCRCPDCPGGVAYVWLDHPIMYCLSCGNRAIGGRWRRVELPPAPDAIVALLVLRPDPRTWVWEPGESVEKLRAENEMLLGGT